MTVNGGQARTIHFKLPDNLTTFRLMAVAAGRPTRFGSGEATITTSRKLMARPALPRIVRVGDAFEAGGSSCRRRSSAGDRRRRHAARARASSLKGPTSRSVQRDQGVAAWRCASR